MTRRLSKIHLAAHTTVQYIVCLHARTFQSVPAFGGESPNNHPVQSSVHPEKSFYMIHPFQKPPYIYLSIQQVAFCVVQTEDTTLCPNGSEKQYVLLFSLFFRLFSRSCNTLTAFILSCSFCFRQDNFSFSKRFRKHLRCHRYLGILSRFIGL